MHDVLQWRMILHWNSYDTLKSGSSIQASLNCCVFTRLNGIVTLTVPRPVRMPCWLIQTDGNNRKVKKALVYIRMLSNDHTNAKKWLKPNGTTRHIYIYFILIDTFHSHLLFVLFLYLFLAACILFSGSSWYFLF